ncbi:MAG: arginyltransferase [Sandaracinaceae bacterium]|jgi:arginine-tRNA-protein transferase|nr:arginyltransferase [Sandaracinaceae bacterium]
MDGPRVLPVIPPEIVVIDQDEPCPYLDGQIARRPMRLPTRRLRPTELDQRLEAGDRRAGPLFYTQACPSCRACEPLRIDTTRFVPTRGQRRAFSRGRRALSVELGPLVVDAPRVRLFERHQSLRGLKKHERELGAEEYHAFLVERAVESFEIRYFLGDSLVGVAITDRGAEAWSAVYTYYEPELPAPHQSLSIGTFSVLTQLELAQRSGVRWLYLGLAISDNPHMRYKLAYLPHERRIEGRWQAFEPDLRGA